MSRQGRTKDEQVVVALYELALLEGSVEAEISKQLVNQRVSINLKGFETICNVLAQANFIKKIGKESIRLTEQGERLALSLLEE